MRDPERVSANSHLSRSWTALAVLIGCLCCVQIGPAATTGPLSLARVMPGADIRTQRVPNFMIEYRASDAGWVSDIVARADAARREVNRMTLDPMMISIHIIIVPDKRTFLKLVGNWAENSLAVAVPATLQIIFNKEALLRQPYESFAGALVHEFAHLYVGMRCIGPLPRWLNEGIAMNIAGEWSLDDAAAVVLAYSLKRLIPLRNIEHDFPVDADPQRLAYRESYSIVRYLVRKTQTGTMREFLTTITGDKGRNRLHEFWEAMYREAMETEWRRSLRTTGNWILLAFSSGMIWTIIMILAFAAWITRRIRASRRRAEFDEDDDERIYAALDEEERRIWGDDDEAGYDQEDDDERWKR